MRQYVEQTVTAFDGVRLDNCHSTPIHLAEVWGNHLLEALFPAVSPSRIYYMYSLRFTCLVFAGRSSTNKARFVCCRRVIHQF